MKSLITASALILTFGFLNLASAENGTISTGAKEKIGVVSVGNAATLEDLASKLEEKSRQKGASSFKIISASGKNKLYGVAEIYK